MARVRVEPLGAEIEVEPGETLANAAWRQGYTWPTRCWGQAECMVCRVKILAGDPAAEPAGREEVDAVANRLRLSADRDAVRLSCRMRVVGDGLVVEKEGVVAPDAPSGASDR